MPLTINGSPFTPRTVLAPMAGITDAPMRALVAQFGVDLLVSEMVASNEFLVDKQSVRDRAVVTLGDIPTSIQIAGRDGDLMARAAQIATDAGADIVDINMGCPAKKVTSGYSGSALMRDPDLALSLIEAVVAATPLPVTLKMRLGWDDETRNAAYLARCAVDAGVQMIAVHGRTRCQFYKGHADWTAVAEVVNTVDVPVLVNGDIVDAASARQALAHSGAAGIMVGRGIQGAPWAIAQIQSELWGAPKPAIPTGAALADLVEGHYDAMLDFYGLDIGPRVARKHLGWYLDHTHGPADMKREILTSKDVKRTKDLLRLAFLNSPQRHAA
ncbi:MAG: tRNA dihydrouridine synthase DusB [Planktomarina sp.]